MRLLALEPRVYGHDVIDKNGCDDSQDDAQEPQEGQGAGNQDDDADPVEDFIDQALRELEKVLNDEQFINDVRDTAKAIHEAMEGQDLEPDAERLGGRDIAVDVETQRTAQRMQDNFRQLRLQLEETHLHNQTAGRIDPRRFMTRKPWEVDFFKAFDPGHYDDTSIELVILVDQSGSMRRRELDVAQTVWTIRQSLQPLDARITVLGFATHGYVMALPSDRAHPKMTKVHNCMGGTKPDESIRQAYRIMESSQRSLKIMLTLTDGDWAGDVVRTERYVQAMNEMGVLTGLVFIGGVADPARHQHEHIIFQGANDVASLVKMSEAIVRMSMSKMADQMITA